VLTFGCHDERPGVLICEKEGVELLKLVNILLLRQFDWVSSRLIRSEWVFELFERLSNKTLLLYQLVIRECR
jgi:hypothetical protein